MATGPVSSGAGMCRARAAQAFSSNFSIVPTRRSRVIGRGIANPIGTIASVAMLLRHSLELNKEADALEAAVAGALESGARTPDIATSSQRALSTREMGDEVLRGIAR